MYPRTKTPLRNLMTLMGRTLTPVMLGLALGVSACAREAPSPDTGSVRRLLIEFSGPAASTPPATLSVSVASGEAFVLHLERPVSGGYYRYTTPPLPADRMNELLHALDERTDILHSEADTRRRIQ